MHSLYEKNMTTETPSILNTTPSMNLITLEKAGLQRNIYKTKDLGILNYVRILKDLTNEYGLEEPEFLTYKDFNVNKRIIFTTHCRLGDHTLIATGNIAIITENDAAFKQIKLIQELYELCEEKYEDSKTQKTKLQNKSTQTDIRPKLQPICKRCRNSHHIAYNCSNKTTKTQKKTIFRKFLNFFA